MTRLYIQPSWIDSCSDHGEWSGGNGQYRGDRSVEVVPTYINGKPNVKAFSDEAIEARREKRKTSIPLVDRVLPQKRRLSTLQAQMQELETSYRNREMSISEYSLYRDLIVAKLQRAEVLYQRAVAVKPTQPDEDDSGLYTELPEDDVVCSIENHVTAIVHTSTIPAWLEGISDDNSCKKVIIKACVWLRKAVQLSQATRNYIKTLSEV